MARVVRPGGLVTSHMGDLPGGGVPCNPVYVTLELMGFASVRPHNSAASEQEAMQRFWKDAGLENVETRMIRIPTVYSDLTFGHRTPYQLDRRAK